MALLGSQVDGSDGSSTSTLWVTGAGLGGGMTPRWSEARKKKQRGDAEGGQPVGCGLIEKGTWILGEEQG